MRIGIGYDIHRLVNDGGRPFVLGGVSIPYIKGIESHSDGDVLLHAICDAMLGAAGLDDIGNYFPVNDAQYDNIKSTELLKKVNTLIIKKGFSVDYIDSVILLEEPKIAPFKSSMKKEIAVCLSISHENINIKATTNEGICAIGRQEAIAAYAVVSLVVSRKV